MGNFNTKLKREEDDISDIRHYIQYLNQEKKRNFEKSIPDSKKSTNSFFSKNSVCNLSNCANFFSFSKKNVFFSSHKT